MMRLNKRVNALPRANLATDDVPPSSSTPSEDADGSNIHSSQKALGVKPHYRTQDPEAPQTCCCGVTTTQLSQE